MFSLYFDVINEQVSKLWGCGWAWIISYYVINFCLPLGMSLGAQQLFLWKEKHWRSSTWGHELLDSLWVSLLDSKSMYLRFSSHTLTNEIMYISCLLLLCVRSYWQAWDRSSSHFMVKLQVINRKWFEAIGSFLHAVTPAEEVQLASHPWKKILPLHIYVKSKCLQLYQPLQGLSVDERMVKGKAQTHFRQYIKDKPRKWGSKYWYMLTQPVTPATSTSTMEQEKAQQKRDWHTRLSQIWCSHLDSRVIGCIAVTSIQALCYLQTCSMMAFKLLILFMWIGGGFWWQLFK